MKKELTIKQRKSLRNRVKDECGRNAYKIIEQGLVKKKGEGSRGTGYEHVKKVFQGAYYDHQVIAISKKMCLYKKAHGTLDGFIESL